MSIRIALYIDGKSFDAEAFVKSMDTTPKGDVHLQKIIKDDMTGVSGKYWQSDVREVESTKLDDSIYKLLLDYKPKLANSMRFGGNRIILEVMVDYGNPTEISGYFFSSQTIKLLSEIDASLDIDVILTKK